MADKKPAKKVVAKKSEAGSKPKKDKIQKFGHGKKYLAEVAKIDKTKNYPVEEALALVKDTSPTKFDATVEVHIQMGVDPKKPEQNVRGTVLLPAGSGKSKKILVLAEDADAKKGLAAGADHAGLEDMIKKIQDGWTDFELVIATPAVMPQVGKLGQTLGTKGLMPNPKAGTVTTDIEKTVSEFKKGRVEFRVDKDSIIHVGMGKVSFSLEDLMTNLQTLMSAIRSAKPTTSKGTYIKKVSLTSTMGPGIKVDLATV